MSFVARVILHHTTSFGSTEHRRRSVARAQAARERAAGWLGAQADRQDGTAGERPLASAGHGPAGSHSNCPAGLVLTGPAAVAWACGGVAPPVDRTAAVDLVWAVIAPHGAALITTNVEAERIEAEYDPAAHGFGQLAVVPWYAPEQFVTAAADLAGAPPELLASDGHPAFGQDASDDLIALRLALSDAEMDDLADLGADAARALQTALAGWRPGERDLDIQARCAAGIEESGADAPVLIVGGDDRLSRFRHPMAAGAPVRHLAMAVAVARRAGLHVALTRFAASAGLDPQIAGLRRRVLGIEDSVLSACAPGATYGDALQALAGAYAANNAENGWIGHYQGGPIGFAQREFEIAPGQSGSRWYAERMAAGHALAWNPSLPGGAKAEDTYLLGADGELRLVTAAPGWPAETNDTRRPARPAVLEVGR